MKYIWYILNILTVMICFYFKITMMAKVKLN